MLMLPRFIAIGEPLVEIMRDTVGIGLDEPGTFLGPYPSGAPVIAADAAALLNMPAGFIGCVGDDDFARCLRARCAHDGLDATYIVTVPDATTGTAIVTYLNDGSRRFVFHVAHAASGRLTASLLDPSYFAAADVVHITGTTLAINEGCHAACVRAAQLGKQAGAWISFDPNLRPELLGGRTVAAVCGPILELADVILPSGREAMLLAGAPDAAPWEACLMLLRQTTAHLVVLKEGAKGSTAFPANGEPLYMPSFPVVEVDPTGAGDCFAAALLSGLCGGLPLPEALRRANAAGALATTVRGPMEGSPTTVQLEHFLAQSI